MIALYRESWRRRRDSNPGYRFWPVCSLSRGVPSTTRPRLRNTRLYRSAEALVHAVLLSSGKKSVKTQDDGARSGTVGHCRRTNTDCRSAINNARFVGNSMRFQMYRKCPHCGSTNVRRSGRLESEAGQHPFHSPYRCRECEQRFWVVSRRTIFVAVAGGAVLTISIFLWSGNALVGRLERPAVAAPAASSPEIRGELVPPPTTAPLLAERQWGTRLDGKPPSVQ